MTGMTASKQKSLVLAVFSDFVENDDIDGLFSFLAHCGIHLRKMGKDVPFADFILDHYRTGVRSYDLESVALDLLTYPPIAERLK